MSWKLKEFERSMYTVFEVIDENEEVIKCFVADDLVYKEKKRKAQLMAAAPELLEAAEKVMFNSDDLERDMQNLYKAINKAKGADE